VSPETIRTSYVYPPIPTRRFDWCAWVDGHEEGRIGYGATEAEATANLREQLDEEDDNVA
jgi:hypothetical protein